MQPVSNPPAAGDEWRPNDEDNTGMNPPAAGSKRPRNNEERLLTSPPTAGRKCPKQGALPSMNSSDGLELSATNTKRPEKRLHPSTASYTPCRDESHRPEVIILGDAGDSSDTPSRVAVDLERPDFTAAFPLEKKKIAVDSTGACAKDPAGHVQKVRNSLLLFCAYTCRCRFGNCVHFTYDLCILNTLPVNQFLKGVST